MAKLNDLRLPYKEDLRSLAEELVALNFRCGFSEERDHNLIYLKRAYNTALRIAMREISDFEKELFELMLDENERE